MVMSDNTIEKHRRIYRRYIDLIKQENRENQDRAKYLSKQYYYDIIADEFCMSAGRIYKIISEQTLLSTHNHTFNDLR